MVFLNFGSILFYSMTFMLGEWKFVWAQNSIGDLVSNTGLSALTDVNYVTYENQKYGVDDLSGIGDDKIRTKVAYLILGCSYASSMRTVLFGYGNIINSCQELQADEEEFKRCIADISRSMQNLYQLSVKMAKALNYMTDTENRYEHQYINTIGDDNDYEDDFDFGDDFIVDYYEEDYEENVKLLEFIISSLKGVEVDLKNDIKFNNCNLRDPQHESTMVKWRQNFDSKVKNTELLFHKHLIEEVNEIISAASRTKYTSLGFVETTQK